MTNLDSILKSRDITLPIKVRLVKAMVFPVGMYGCESWTVKKAERRRIDAFELWCWRRPLRVPWTARRSNQSIIKEISPGCSFERTDAEAETPILWPPHAKSWLIGKDPDAGRDWGQEDKGTTEDEMAGWHHQLDAHDFGWILGVGDGQGGLACCNSWSHRVGHDEWLNWTELMLLVNTPAVDFLQECCWGYPEFCWQGWYSTEHLRNSQRLEFSPKLHSFASPAMYTKIFQYSLSPGWLLCGVLSSRSNGVPLVKFVSYLSLLKKTILLIQNTVMVCKSISSTGILVPCIYRVSDSDIQCYLHYIYRLYILYTYSVLHNSYIIKEYIKIIIYNPVNYYWHLPKAFAICFYGDWTLHCCSCWPSTHPEGSSGWRIRHFVLQGN